MILETVANGLEVVNERHPSCLSSGGNYFHLIVMRRPSKDFVSSPNENQRKYFRALIKGLCLYFPVSTWNNHKRDQSE